MAAFRAGKIETTIVINIELREIIKIDIGFISDGTVLREDDLVVFTQDTKQKNKIFKVKFYELGDSTAGNPSRIHLQIVDDSTAIADTETIKL